MSAVDGNQHSPCGSLETAVNDNLRNKNTPKKQPFQYITKGYDYIITYADPILLEENHGNCFREKGYCEIPLDIWLARS